MVAALFVEKCRRRGRNKKKTMEYFTGCHSNENGAQLMKHFAFVDENSHCSP
jgi:hypothetical protein